MPAVTLTRWAFASSGRSLMLTTSFAVLVLITLLPVWMVGYFPSQDGPVHLLIADVASGYDEPDADLLRTYFAPSPHVEPNLAVYPLLALFSALTDSDTAEKLLVSLFTLLFAGAGLYAVTSINRHAWPLSLLFLPMIFGYHLHMGFYNFVLSLIGFVFVFGYWLRYRQALTWPRLLLLAAVALALVLDHLVGFVVLAYVIGVSSLVLWIHARRTSELPRPSCQQLGREWLGLGLAFLPAILVAASFVLRHRVDSEALLSERSLLIDLFTASFLFSFSRLERILALPLLLTGAAIAIWNLRASLRNGLGVALLTAISGLALIYLFVPLNTRGVPLVDRLVPFMAALGVLWLASGYIAATAARHRLVVLGAVLSTLLLTAHRVAAYREIDDYAREYMSAASHIEPHSTLLPINFWGASQPLGGDQITWRTDPFLHLGARIAVQTDGVYLRSPLLSSVVYGYFPIVYRPQVDPFRLFDGLALEPEDKPPTFADFASYNDRTPGRLDYVLFWPMTPDIAAKPAVRVMVSRLSRHYDLVHVSPGRGLVHLYRRRAPADPASSRTPVLTRPIRSNRVKVQPSSDRAPASQCPDCPLEIR